jgi:hypothetical protein
LLANFFAELRAGERPTHLDLYIEHRRRSHDLERAAGPTVFETRADFDKRLEQQEKTVQQMEAQLKKRRTDFDLEAAGKPLPHRFHIAMQMGLSLTAADQLLGDPDAIRKDPSASRELLMLMLTCGRIDEVKGDPQQRNVFPDPFIHVLVAAADGDYEVADEYLANTIRHERQRRSEALLAGARDIAFRGQVDPNRLLALPMVARMAAEQADLRTLRALLTLEKGDNRAAAQQFRAALELTLPVEFLQDMISRVGSPDCLTRAAHLYVPPRMQYFNFEYLPLADYYNQLLAAAAN